MVLVIIFFKTINNIFSDNLKARFFWFASTLIIHYCSDDSLMHVGSSREKKLGTQFYHKPRIQRNFEK